MVGKIESYLRIMKIMMAKMINGEDDMVLSLMEYSSAVIACDI